MGYKPPRASHFGGVWERAIGKVREVIKGYLQPKDDRLLGREEFMTMLLHAVRIVNSTPLWETANSPNEPQPISLSWPVVHDAAVRSQAFPPVGSPLRIFGHPEPTGGGGGPQ